MRVAQSAARRRGRTALVAAAVTALALVPAGCSRGEGPADLGSAESIAEAFGCTNLEQVGELPGTPDEYTCESAGQPVIIFRAESGAADAVRTHLRADEWAVGQVTEEWYVACSDEPTCTAIERDLDVTFP